MPAYRIFCSYAHEDERLRARLEEQLAPLRHEGLIDDWYDHEILPGQSYNAAIAVALDAADVILLLVSASFLASDYCYQRELRHALERRRQGQTAVVPVILHDCDWQTSLFGGIEALPDRGQPVSSRRWKTRPRHLPTSLGASGVLSNPESPADRPTTGPGITPMANLKP